MPDREGGLWLALGVGLARVEAQSPLSIFGPTEGLRAAGGDVFRFNGRLYIAHGQGVQYLAPATGSTLPRIVPVTGVANQCWAFTQFDDPDGGAPQLLLSASDGLYRIVGDKALPIVESLNRSFGAFVTLQSRIDPTRVWVGLADGLASVRWTNGKWVNEGRIPDIRDQVRSLQQDLNGNVWAGTQSSGLLIVRGADAVGETRPMAPVVERYGAEQGLAAGGSAVLKVDDKLFVTVAGKVVTLDPATNRFVPDQAFEVVERDTDTDLVFVTQGPDGRIFVNSGRRSAVLTRQADGTYAVDKQLFSRFALDNNGAFYPEKDGVLWLGSLGKLARFDTNRFERTTPSYAALIRRITVNQAEAISPEAADGAASIELPSTSRSVRFEFAAPSYLNERSTQYQSRLDGLDADWSAWSAESRRDYTNLAAGTYRFRVRARNELTQLSDEGVYGFAILPPWYRTWWAYLLYLALAGMAMFAVDRLQRRRVVGRERQRAEFAEARLRAESAEALARSEADRNRNIELLSEIGRDITASLDFDTIFDKLYGRVNQLADADVFGVGLYHPEQNEIEYRLAIEEGKRYAPVLAEHHRPQSAAGVVHRTPRAGVHQRRRAGVPQLHPVVRRGRPRARRRHHVEGGAVDHLPAAGLEGQGARHRHHPELQAGRLHRASPQHDAEPGRVHGDRARQRRRLPPDQRAGARQSPPVRGSAARAGRRRRGRRRQERVPVDGQPRTAHPAHLGAGLRQDHQEAPRRSHLPDPQDRR